LLFVFDELDKLEGSADQNGIEGFNELLQNLKTLLTASGATFIFVAGRGIHDAWRMDIERGDSLYESVFSHVEYVPALWEVGDQLCDRLLKRATLQDADVARDLAHFRNYLAFDGRGIPRRALRALQKYVRIDHRGRATLAFDAGDLRRF